MAASARGGGYGLGSSAKVLPGLQQLKREELATTLRAPLPGIELRSEWDLTHHIMIALYVKL
jgi:hypothetical protein